MRDRKRVMNIRNKDKKEGRKKGKKERRDGGRERREKGREERYSCLATLN